MMNLTREHLILVELLLRSVSHSFGALALFAPSKAVATTPYWRGEVAGVVWVVSTLPMLFYVLAHPTLLLRRIPRAEQIPRQKIIKALFALGGMVVYAGSFISWGFDYNLASIPIPVALLGDLLIAGGSLLIWQVFRINAYASSIVTVESEQPVISTGLYALVRHPLYSASLLLVIGVPVALGALWILAFLPFLLAVIIWRLTNEERYLRTHLPGYQDYCARVTHRLIPFIW
ncbi:MAG TPA: isoprenylcysteine carboxylmethyltransferase family protein [Ktedonobacteraceae bacterium]|nr:isoprenylcysteine carboxylmethyltransferase family protein [Ktedonobacteraceae bacterium]